MTQYHGYLDRFSVIGQCVVAEGWANERDLALWYKDELLSLSVARVSRPDLVDGLGPEAESWGFSFCAALPERIVDRTRFRLRFNAGMTLNPSERFARAADQQFDAMVDAFRASVAKTRGSLLEIGARARSGTIYRGWFPDDIDYLGMDISEGPNVDIVTDAHHMARPIARQFGHIFSIAVFEHLLMPWKVALEMNKLLVHGGTALIISHGAWPLHEEPWDFFRFSKDSWHGLFNAHTGFRVVDAQQKYGACVVPQYLHSVHHAEMSLGDVYLLSGCVVERIGDARVAWDAEVGEVYDLRYSHG